MKCISQLELAQMVGTGIRPQYLAVSKAYPSAEALSLKLNISTLDREFLKMFFFFCSSEIFCNVKTRYFNF